MIGSSGLGLSQNIKRRHLSRYSWLLLLAGGVLIAGLWLFVWQLANDDFDRTIAETSLSREQNFTRMI